MQPPHQLKRVQLKMAKSLQSNTDYHVFLWLTVYVSVRSCSVHNSNANNNQREDSTTIHSTVMVHFVPELCAAAWFWLLTCRTKICIVTYVCHEKHFAPSVKFLQSSCVTGLDSNGIISVLGQKWRYYCKTHFLHALYFASLASSQNYIQNYGVQNIKLTQTPK